MRIDQFDMERTSATHWHEVEYDLEIDSIDLINRIRMEQSVLLVPGGMFGVGRGIRFGYGYDIEHTLAGLACVDEILAEIAR